ncbi:dipeptidase PepE [Fulvivirgaceae bacterium PWU4]|uniref:dipeptidase E n=1 Tax=Chryseosolibacter histidini TaxID=2782349 RepID=A0AAP2GNH3_9BACT|nr:dipeptidase PepE [Chryseosolibacter histidini]MBT1698018.1 dipeptidase PepE [Chryseosolibacter histidini]
MTKVLMLSNSTLPGTPFFTWPRPWVQEFLKTEIRKLLFIPFAAVTFSFDEYEEKVKEVFEALGYDVQSVHRQKDKKQAVAQAEAIITGGGNTFALLARMYEFDLLEIVRKKVQSGTPYIGWSAGANLACPTIMTTNDMPVVRPPSFEALDLVPFQINPHYHELKFEGQGGETRKERLEEFLVMNPSKKIIGLPEGMLLQRNGDNLVLRGNGVAKLYKHGKPVEELKPDHDLSFLL